MHRHRRLEALEAQLTPVQLSELWVRRIREFERVEDYVAWFNDDVASGAARRSFLMQATTVILRNRINDASMRSSGYEGRRPAISQVASRLFQFWVSNQIYGYSLVLAKEHLRFMASQWCTLADLWSEAANANPDQANEWLRQETERAAMVASLLRQEACSVSIGDIAAAADSKGAQQQSWLRQPPWLAHKSAQILKAGHCWPEFMELSSWFRESARSLERNGRPVLFRGLDAQIKALNRIYLKLISSANHAVAIGLLPPLFAADADQASGERLNHERQTARKKFLEPLLALLRNDVSESDEKQRSSSSENIARKLLAKYEKPRLRVAKQGVIFFTHVANTLKAQARELLTEIDALPDGTADSNAHQLAAESFLVLESSIKGHISREPDDHSEFAKLYKKYTLKTIEQLINFYRAIVPGGEKATTEELLELGVDGIRNALKLAANT